jgi:hypothetical protein
VGEDLWSLPVQAAGCAVGELQGFAVEAQDGPVGTVARGAIDAGRSYLVVSLDPALGVAKAMLPAGIVEHVDRLRALVRIGCSRFELAGARFKSDRVRDGAYRAELAIHYSARPAARPAG